LIQAFDHFFKKPRCGEVYNIGGSRFSHCSMLEAIRICEEICGRELEYSYQDDNRIGDHIWYVTDVSKFQDHYPKWSLTKDIRTILTEIYELNVHRWQLPVAQ
jgi:CDP-paratose 2-epimerase